MEEFSVRVMDVLRATTTIELNVYDELKQKRQKEEEEDERGTDQQKKPSLICGMYRNYKCVGRVKRTRTRG